MKYIEIAILIVAYSSLIVTIFVSYICYRKNIEKWETLALAVSLLLLIIAMTIPAVIGESDRIETTNIFMLISMIIVGLTTPLSIVAERRITFPNIWRNLLFAIVAILFIVTIVSFLTPDLEYVQYLVVIFLAISVVTSMLINLRTKPERAVAHQEKSSRFFAIIFLILVPVFLFESFILSELGYALKIGFTLPLAFILLAVNKLLDDLQKLSLINPKNEPSQQQFINYALTPREKDIAMLLIQGKTYKQISETLFISIPTVKTHTSNIYKKCKVSNKVELTVLITG